MIHLAQQNLAEHLLREGITFILVLSSYGKIFENDFLETLLDRIVAECDLTKRRKKIFAGYTKAPRLKCMRN